MAAKLDALNGPVLQLRRLASLTTIAPDLAVKNEGLKPADCMQQAARILMQAESTASARIAEKRAGGKSYKPDGGGSVKNLGQPACLSWVDRPG